MKKAKRVVEHGAGTKTAFLAIRELIVTGSLAPGSWLVESNLASRLGISRTPIRAALLWLQHEGYVVAREGAAKSRVNVAPLTRQDAIELYAIVGHLEGIAGRLAAELPESKRKPLVATLTKLNARLTKMAQASKTPRNEFASVDTQFHDTIVEAGAGQRLLTIYNAIKPQTERYWQFYATSGSGDLSKSITEHNQIIEAISTGNGNATERKLKANWENGTERLIKLISEAGERGNW